MGSKLATLPITDTKSAQARLHRMHSMVSSPTARKTMVLVISDRNSVADSSLSIFLLPNERNKWTDLGLSV